MKNTGTMLLAAWLILFGLKLAIDLHFRYDDLVVGVLAVVAGVFLVLRR
jgi:hypothetical protein